MKGTGRWLNPVVARLAPPICPECRSWDSVVELERLTGLEEGGR
jgi:hypothetical protein